MTDESGTPLPGATVRIDGASHAVRDRSAVSDASGAFQIGSLPPAADYTVSVTLAGMAGITLHDFEVVAGRPTPLTLVLTPASKLQETMEVRAHPRVVELEDTSRQTRFSSEFIEALPILGRDYQDILTLAPGVSDIDGDGNPNIHGARDTDVVTFVDGVSTTDPLTGKRGAQLNIESIQDLEIKTSGATAEYGRAQGGFVNVITKSGGNNFQGTFKMFWRGSALDGDGAGTDDPRLHSGVGEVGIRDLKFNDFLPFLSLEGPVVKDHAWFFLANEYVQLQEPINALNTAFVAGTKEFREFGKLTWQAGTNHRVAFSVNYDPQEYTNQGLNSFIRTESGYTDRMGGTILTLRLTSILSPNVSLENSLSQFTEQPARVPTTDPDTNGNGILAIDSNGDHHIDASERDPGEDYDLDGVFDVAEGPLQGFEDLDGDHRITWRSGCEGEFREDRDCDGHLDNVLEDTNRNGVWDPGEIDVDGDRTPELGDEDRNHDGVLNDTPVPVVLYPYGRLKPIPPDRDYTLDQNTGLVSGPFFNDIDDHRNRFTARQDLSVYVPEAFGSHDLKIGGVIEREGFQRGVATRSVVAPFIVPPRGGCGGPNPGRFLRPCVSTARVLSPASDRVENQADGLTAGLYLQDTWKPRPNLSLGLGVRFDRERDDTSGFSFFDPAPERSEFDRLTRLAGETLSTAGLLGTDDGLRHRGVLGDQMFYSATGQVSSELYALRRQLQVAALGRLTRPHTLLSFTSDEVASLLPEISSGGEIDPDKLLAFGVFPQTPREFRLTNNNLSPRLAVSWDPWANGRSKASVSWGRYYDRLFLDTVVGEEGPDLLTRYYTLDPYGFDGRPDHGLGDLISRSPASVTEVDRGLRTPFSDELTIAFEREIAPEVALSVAFIDRRYRDQLQDKDVNHTLRVDPLTGIPEDRLGLLLFLPGSNPQDAGNRASDGIPDLYVQNFFFNQVLRVGNFNSARYRGIEVEMKKRMARRWELQASYAYSRAVGAAEEFRSQLGNDPSVIESEFGYLDYDQRHVVKINAAVHLPRDWQFGTACSWSSGLPYSVITRVFALDDANYLQFRTRFGAAAAGPYGPYFQPERRNSHRNDAVLDLNMRARKSFVLAHNVGAFFIEVFNVLNSGDLRVVNYLPGELERYSRDDATPLTRLQVEGQRRFGRRIQLGLQFDF